MIAEFINNCNFTHAVFIKIGPNHEFKKFLTDLNIWPAVYYYEPFRETAGKKYKIEDHQNLPDVMSAWKVDRPTLIWTSYVHFEYLLNNHKEILKNTEYLCLSGYNLISKEVIKDLPGKWILRVDDLGGFLFENYDYRESLINKNGAWSVKNSNDHVFDKQLAQGIFNFMKSEGVNTCVDFGCGPGKYVEYFNSLGLETIGYDGNPFTEEITNGTCKIIDLSVPFNLDKQFDCVMSLEVGEHIPQIYQEDYINNLVNHSNGLVILSWAIPGQEGYGHVNCQTNEYIKDIFDKKGFNNLIYMDNLLRLTADNSWFKNTVMIFKKK